jgi:predicted nucleic acid-binding protein
VPEPPVTNASPLIILSRAGRLGLLRLAGETIIVPSAVVDEVRQRGEDDPAYRAIVETPWLLPRATPPIPASIQRWGLGAGESAALAWALAQPGTEAIIDDLRARHCAASLGIPVRGLVGLVLSAKDQGMVPLARPVLYELRQFGLYVSDQLLADALRRAGE